TWIAGGKLPVELWMVPDNSTAQAGALATRSGIATLARFGNRIIMMAKKGWPIDNVTEVASSANKNRGVRPG
ncbi:MAG TPA: hypothetical protein VF793_12300, partial [Telluria sp.]